MSSPLIVDHPEPGEEIESWIRVVGDRLGELGVEDLEAENILEKMETILDMLAADVETKWSLR